MSCHYPFNSPAAQRIRAAGLAYQAELATKTPPALPTVRMPIVKRDWLIISSEPPDIKRPSAASILADASMLSGFSREIIKGETRQLGVIVARHYAMQRMRDELGLSTSQIGRQIGGKDHTTVLNAIRPKNRQRVADWLAKITKPHPLSPVPNASNERRRSAE